MTHTRLDRIYELMTASGVQILALNPGPTLTYLTGLHFHLMERPTILFVEPGQKPVLVLPELEKVKLGSANFDIHAFPYEDDPATWPLIFKQAALHLNLDGKQVGVEPIRLRYLELGYLQSAAPGAAFISAAPALEELRVIKDEQEVVEMRRAVQIAQKSLQAVLPSIKAGVTEKEIAAELTIQLLQHGSDPELPFSPIVASGANSANPHAGPTDRRLRAGDLLVIDWGARSNGYCSDLTRTFAVGKVSTELETIHEVVQRANAAGRQAGRPGGSAGEVDRDARRVISDAGYGEYFTHRTGHGLGLEDHETSSIFANNDQVLLPGMTYTVEPGIYLQGVGGVRIEDNILVTAGGTESLSDFPRELMNL
mgnify:CR=1 FL=1